VAADIQKIESLQDSRVDAYRDLVGRARRGESAFIAEGAVLTHRLLASSYGVESVLVSEESAAEFIAALDERPGAKVPLYVVTPSTMAAVVGFNFHRGVLAAGKRPAGEIQAEFWQKVYPKPAEDQMRRIFICPEVTKPENLGLIFRSAAGFGLDAVLLGERCGDPLSRRCLRVSMGGSLRVPFFKSTGLSSDLQWLKSNYKFEIVGAVLDSTAATPETFRWPQRCGLMIGNESAGIRTNWLELCDARLTIPMREGTDSLNMGVAAGIFAFAMTRTALR